MTEHEPHRAIREQPGVLPLRPAPEMPPRGVLQLPVPSLHELAIRTVGEQRADELAAQADGLTEMAVAALCRQRAQRLAQRGLPASVHQQFDYAADALAQAHRVRVTAQQHGEGQAREELEMIADAQLFTALCYIRQGSEMQAHAALERSA